MKTIRELSSARHVHKTAFSPGMRSTIRNAFLPSVARGLLTLLVLFSAAGPVETAAAAQTGYYYILWPWDGANFQPVDLTKFAYAETASDLCQVRAAEMRAISPYRPFGNACTWLEEVQLGLIGNICTIRYRFGVNRGDCGYGDPPPPPVEFNYAFFVPQACPQGTRWITEAHTCVPWRNRFHDGVQCPVGNPIYPLAGSKGQQLELGNWTLGASIGLARPVTLGYNTRRKVPVNDATLRFSATSPAAFGELWTSSLHKSLVREIVDANGVVQTIQAARGTDKWVSFNRQSDGSYAADGDISDRLQAVVGGWRFFDAAAISVESYDAAGKILGVAYTGGATLSYAYSNASTPTDLAPVAGLLLSVSDQSGRSVQFQYEQPAGLSAPRVNQITGPDGRAIGIGYNAQGHLSQLGWPNGESRQYLYERADIPWALTGVIDENARRQATYGYDSQGRANETQRAGGVDHYRVSYSDPPGWNIVETYDSVAGVIWRDHFWQLPQGTVLANPNGSSVTLVGTLVQGKPRLASQSQPAGSGCAASASGQTYDANGNISSRDDFNGVRVCYANDLSRNLETVRVEGLASGTPCTVTAPGLALPEGARKTSTQWHPRWSLVARQAEPGRITTYVYNGQPDPFAGGTQASCAPSTAVLPDGNAIVVLCRQIEQATDDANGSQGFAAPLQAGVPAREQKWTYNALGQVLTHDGPRTDVADITVNEYYSNTAFSGADPSAVGHTRGDLKQTTSAVGQVTGYTLYNQLGQLLQMVDPNGVITDNTYDLRQRLTSATVAGLTTRYEYWPTGLLKRVTLPDLSWVHHDYDDAHRLVRVSDSLGNSISYTLDNLGNRTTEEVRDPANILRRQLTRSIDALGRVQQVTGRE